MSRFKKIFALSVFLVNYPFLVFAQTPAAPVAAPASVVESPAVSGSSLIWGKAPEFPEDATDTPPRGIPPVRALPPAGPYSSNQILDSRPTGR